MALNKLKFNSINVTPAASEALKFNSSADGFETGAAGGAMTFISKATASSSSTISITSGIDSTYKEYIFYFNNIHPATNSVQFSFQASTDSGSSYGVTATTTLFRAIHNEADSETSLSYMSNDDYAQSTSFLTINNFLSNENDMCLGGGTLHIFNPSSTTFVKHFISRTSANHGTSSSVYEFDYYTAGYFNTTSAIDAIQFKMSTGNIDAGDICLYGIN